MPLDAALREASPLIVMGMHRSGTRLVAELLSRLGVFMGRDLQADAESVTFLRINEAVLHQCGAFWSEPMAAHVVLAQPAELERLTRLVEDTLAAEFERYAQSSWHGTRPFGWKDPRNTFTLPVWRGIFPNCRAIHVLRHGVDVAASLARRHRESCLSATGGARPSALAVFEDHAQGVLSSRRGWTVAEAFSLWEQHVEKARIQSAELGDRALEIRFEDLLTRPGEVVPTLARFCGLGDSPADAGTLPTPDPDRAWAFRRDPGLVELAAAEAEALARYGY